ncbi:MAG: hypothetical protein HKN75_01105 [Bacteroidia bacterium]|nr:hypothetical protein [Bacteroidia bacterium]
MKNLLFIACISLLVIGCEEDKTTYDPVPEIGIVSVSPVVANEFQDDITVVLSYIDGDGDLGENDPNVNNLFITDNRINITQAFRIPQLSPSGSEIALQGQLDVIIPGTGITDGSNQQQATFTLYVKDRAGNESNRVTTQFITIKKP